MINMMKKENITKFNLLKNNVTSNIYDEDLMIIIIILHNKILTFA